MAGQDWKEQYKKQLARRNNNDQKQTNSWEPEEDSKRTAKATSHHASSSVVPENLQSFRRIIVAIWIAITVIQVIIWLLIGIFSGQLPDPWWLWTGVAGGAVVFLVRYISAELQHRKQKQKND